MNPNPAHDARIVEQFTRWAQPFAELDLHADPDGMGRLLAALAPEAEAAVLDVACGPGIVACAIAPRVRQVTGIDLTPAMIEQARRRQQRLGLHNLDWRIGDAMRLPFADGQFDRVVTRYSFHHLLNPGAVLAEMQRVCRRGGRIVVVDATPTAATQAAYDAMERLRDRSHASALTQPQLRALGHARGLEELGVDAYRLEAALAPLADAADLPALQRLFEADIDSGLDRIGVAAWRAADGIRFHFPISVVAWRAS